jgi:hypothetical protein
MPAIKQDRRVPLLMGDLKPTEKGDLTFLEYVPLVRAWRKERRWTTAHNEFRRLFDVTDEQAAKFLAFLEFYIREVHPYENEKFEENGEI